MRLVHVIAGALALLSGAVALYATKGAKLHRRSGALFAYAMLFLSASGSLMAAARPRMITVIAGALTFYLVLTGLLALRRPVPRFRGVEAAALLAAVTVGLAGTTFGFEALASGTGKRDGYPAAMYLAFGALALLAALGDVRLMRSGRIEPAHRLARHLWRMCAALLVANGAFFLGLPRLFPEPLRRSGLLAIPPLCVLLTLVYWLVKVSAKTRGRSRVPALLGPLGTEAEAPPRSGGG
jgi:uncharacterized membrane protein